MSTVSLSKMAADSKVISAESRTEVSIEGVEAQQVFFQDLYPQIDNKKLLWKLDRHIIPGVTLLYLLSFIDRGNIGNAAIEGMSTEIGLIGNQFNICLTVFYLTYSPFELPSNIIMNVLKPHVWLPSMMIAWGIVITLTGLVQSYGGLVAARLCLGIAEAGLYPGVAFYLTRWYTRQELQYRQALFYAAASTAGAFSGLLAFGIENMNGVGKLAGWRWIFMIEGLLTIVVASCAYFFIHDYPDTAKFITEEEREFILRKLQTDSHQIPVAAGSNGATAATAASTRSKRSYVLAAIKDWQCWCHIFIHWSVVTTAYALSVFIPTIIKNMGYTSAHAQLMSVPPYVTASICAVVTAKIADRYQIRSPLIMICHVVMIAGYLVAMNIDVTTNPNGVYAGIFITTVAVFCAFPAMISWLAVNLDDSNKRSAGMAIHIGLGNLSGAMCVNFFRAQDAPQYKLGYGMEILFVSVGFIMAVVINICYYRINKRKQKEINEGKYDNYFTEELLAMGDRNPYFKYSH